MVYSDKGNYEQLKKNLAGLALTLFCHGGQAIGYHFELCANRDECDVKLLIIST